MREASNLTPMFRQYQALKREHPNAILLFRMGDFYEMFFEDARVASGLLELTLTARGKGTDNVVPMCGFPHHQLEAYSARLVRAGQRVAICDQVEDPRKAKGLVRREVVRIVTPGTVTDPGQLEAKDNAWLCSVASAAKRLGAAFLDLSTGEFLAWESGPEGEAAWDDLAERLRSFSPREIIHTESFEFPEPFRAEELGRVLLTATEPYAFSPTAADELLRRQFGVASLDGFGFRERPAALAAAGGLFQYAQETQKCGLEHINELLFHEPARYVLLDPATRRNLELERSLRDGGRQGSLLHGLDATLTPAGGRMLRRWLMAPLLDPAEISGRHDAVEELLGRPDLRGAAREELKGIQDIERLLARAVGGTINPRELLGLRVSLERLPALLEALESAQAGLLRDALDGMDRCEDVATRLSSALVDEPPATLRDGGVIRAGFSSELDELRGIRKDGRTFIAEMEAKERESSGIASLKIRFNKVFGYFIEVSKPNLHLVPEHYHRKQTISSGERFVTPELKEYETKVLHAQERIEELETELFRRLRGEVAAQSPRLKAVARVAALVDVLAGLAEVAAAHDYVRPLVHDGDELSVVAGRHPVVERSLTDTRFVPNDTELTARSRAVAVLTGPNMGGKSTYLRQVAQIVLLAQSGSFVPAERAEIGLVDRVFCRVGASDSLAEGQSTFMVEMTETANILHHATPRSLVLLDEIGRGTATFDGLSIAWAVIEHLDGLEGGPPRTLFATHYHELTELAVELESVVNLRMAVREWGDRVVFLHRVERGAADRSYGIHVARLAGVPQKVVERAAEILANLERDEYGRDGQPRRSRRRGQAAHDSSQTSLFNLFDDKRSAEREPSGAAAEVLAALREQDANELTPLQALSLLSEWRRRLRDEEPSGPE